MALLFSLYFIKLLSIGFCCSCCGFHLYVVLFSDTVCKCCVCVCARARACVRACENEGDVAVAQKTQL